MFQDAAFGQYRPGDSLLHRLDPRGKILVLIYFIVTLLVCRSPLAMLCLTGYAVGLCFLSGIRAKQIVASLRPLLPVLIFAFLVNFFMPRAEDPLLFSCWIFKASWHSLFNAVVLTLRVMGLVLLSNLFLTLTTAAMRLCDGVSDLMRPLERFGVPVEDIAMMMSIALRFVPILLQEADRIMKAQSSRGADYDTGGFTKRIKGFVTVLVPLFIQAFRRADALAEAMEVRAYRSGAPRTRLNPLVFKKRDFVFLLLSAAFLTLLLCFDPRWQSASLLATL